MKENRSSLRSLGKSSAAAPVQDASAAASASSVDGVLQSRSRWARSVLLLSEANGLILAVCPLMGFVGACGPSRNTLRSLKRTQQRLFSMLHPRTGRIDTVLDQLTQVYLLVFRLWRANASKPLYSATIARWCIKVATCIKFIALLQFSLKVFSPFCFGSLLLSPLSCFDWLLRHYWKRAELDDDITKSSINWL